MSDVPQPYDPYQHDPHQREPPPHAEQQYAGQQYAGQAYGPPPRPIPKVTRLQYLYAYQFIFDSGNWFLNLVMGSLAYLSSQMIPIIGPLVFSGYQYEVLDHLHRNRTMPYPDFDFNRFGDYLARGAPPFVVGLIFGFLLAPLIAIFYIAGVLTLPLTYSLVESADAPPAVVGVVTMLVGVLLLGLFFLLIAFISLLTGPMSLRAGLSGSIGEGFNFTFVFDFIKRMWFDMLLAYLWLSVVGTLWYFIGLMFFCIGAYPAIAWSQMAATHMNWQLYEIYLDRGGMQIPLKGMEIPAKGM